MTKIMPGIYQMKIPIPNNPLGYTNTYLVQGGDERLLIDAGWDDKEALQSLSAQLAEIGVDIRDITKIIVTHAHFDHYGLAGKVKQLSMAKIALHYLDKNLLAPVHTNANELLSQNEHWFYTNGVPTAELPATRFAFAPMRRFSSIIPPDITLRDREIISVGPFRLQVVWTPGHSPGHICLYEPTHKILFAGDHILPVITPNISLQPQSNSNPLGDFLNSLNKVKQLDVNLVLPAHENLFEDLNMRADEIHLHHKLRNTEILEAIGTKPKTAYQISTLITWMPEFGGINFQNLGPSDKRMAVSETLAHLMAMRINGRVVQVSKDDMIHYQCTR
jgi:glyoxylase-like metal-dependent hydrolase (beta-lactamase superfamily II)